MDDRGNDTIGKNFYRMGGGERAEEVVCLGFMLDIGNIKEPVDSRYRKNLIYSIYAQNQYGKSMEMDEELKLVGEVCANELLRLRKYLEDGEAIRVWYSDTPYSRCGFYSLCRILQNYKMRFIL